MAKTAAIIGGGVIGSGWAARFLLSGWNARVFDPAPNATQFVRRTLENARRSYPALFDTPLPQEGALLFASDIEDAVRGAAWIQESVPERIEIKRETYQAIQQHSSPGTIIASSTSGFKPSDLQKGAARPNEIMVAHPFNPVYLLPLVELVSAKTNSLETVASAKAVLTEIGFLPLHVKTEIDGHIADRLLEAAWREALWLVRDNAATTEEIDESIRMGFGLRWAQMGLFETYRIAGGDAGMEHFIQQFGPCLSLPWTRLTDVPEMTQDLAAKIAKQSDEQSGAHEINELERIRDANLVTILRGLKSQKWGAGSHILNLERQACQLPDVEPQSPIRTVDRTIPPDWADYNGHVNEARYLELFSKATDRFLELVGCDEAYVATSRSYFTLETSLRHLNETFVGERVLVDTYCLFGKGKKLHLYHVLYNRCRKELATGEHLLVHIDLKARASSPPSEEIESAVAAIVESHAKLSMPKFAEPKLSFAKRSSPAQQDQNGVNNA